jgi:hypothetical protein
MSLAELDRIAVQQLVDELFILTDRKEWSAAEALFVDTPIEVDMTSLVGGDPLRVTAAELFAGFRWGLHAGKLSHHMATNYRIALEADRATVLAHGYAWNRVAALPPGQDLWETWGNYLLDAVRTPAGWRLSAFRYFSKLTRGNDAVRTHQP